MTQTVPTPTLTYVDTLCYYDGPQVVRFQAGAQDYLAVALPEDERTAGKNWPMVVVKVSPELMAAAIEDWSDPDLRQPFIEADAAWLIDLEEEVKPEALPLPLAEDWVPLHV